MLYNIARTLPETENLTIKRVIELQRRLERDVEAVVARWIQETGQYNVSIDVKTSTSPSLAIVEGVGTCEATDLHIHVKASSRLSYGLSLKEEQ